MSDFVQELKYKLQPIQEKLGMGEKPIGRLLIYVGIVVIGFGVLLWAIVPSGKPLTSNARNPDAVIPDAEPEPDAPPREIPGGSRVAPGS
ncbi:MAG: hypothetical protein NCW75_02115 [Phycisphaera sp.]|nr:MAG: hypothetical protein NCW75_02115 [Phycisphaera sp.]